MRSPPLIEVQPNGSRPPFFLIHPAGGHVLFAHRFARLLPDDQPLYGLQAVGLDGREAPIASVPDMADRYLEAIRARQPRGPYFLGGPSFGGYIAYEIACRLARAGERVGLLALFDAYGPGYPRRLSFPRCLLDHLRFLLRSPRSFARHVIDRLRARLRGFSTDLGYEPWPGAIGVAEAAYVEPIRQVVMANDRAAAGYRPSPFPGRVHLFRATITPNWIGRRFDDEANGWGALAAEGVEVIPVVGTHQFIFDEPAVLDLAPKFSLALRRAQGEVAPASSARPR